MTLRRRSILLAALATGAAKPVQAQSLRIQPVRADAILVEKAQRRLVLLRDGQALRSFQVALGGRPVGPKTAEGDLRTPEGRYAVSAFNPQSRFFRAIGISYPEPPDLARARRLGVDPGGNIAIHGLSSRARTRWGDEHWRHDWTLGCIAVTDAEIEAIWDRVELGTPVLIMA